MMKYAIAIILGCATIAVYAQASDTVPAKDTPAEQALVKAAKQLADSSKSLNDVRQQAITALTANQKTLNDQIAAKGKELNDKLKADKKYKPLVDEIEGLQKQLADLNQTATTKFQQDSAVFQQNVNTDSALISGLIPVVKQENGFDQDTNFDQATQTWKKPKAAAKK